MSIELPSCPDHTGLKSQQHAGVKPVCHNAMDTKTHCARITGPIAYLGGGGRKHHIPLGPCLVENMGERLVDVIWGAQGQSSAALPIEEIEAARHLGHLEFISRSSP